MTELLPCPFCGAPDDQLFVESVTGGYQTHCTSCLAQAPTDKWDWRVTKSDAGAQDDPLAMDRAEQSFAPPASGTADIAGLIARLLAWESLVSSGYEVPAAGTAMVEAASALQSQAAMIETLAEALRDMLTASQRQHTFRHITMVDAQAKADEALSQMEKHNNENWRSTVGLTKRE